MTDTLRPWAKAQEIKSGDILVASDRYSCLTINHEYTVFRNGSNLFVHCAAGTHILNGDEKGNLVGFWRKENATTIKATER